MGGGGVQVDLYLLGWHANNIHHSWADSFESHHDIYIQKCSKLLKMCTYVTAHVSIHCIVTKQMLIYNVHCSMSSFNCLMTYAYYVINS